MQIGGEGGIAALRLALRALPVSSLLLTAFAARTPLVLIPPEDGGEGGIRTPTERQ
jgi:hypothetical protein